MGNEKIDFDCDILVVGGGVNGAGIAREAAGRGLSVVLCEKDDLASHTSSASTKLIHGGLRYLEFYEFRLVRKALIEREVLLRSAPHIMWPLRFVMPHEKGLRPAWLIRAGMLLYDCLARRVLLPGSRGVDLRKHAAGRPLNTRFKRGFIYSDGWVDDARLVVLQRGLRGFRRHFFLQDGQHGDTVARHQRQHGLGERGALRQQHMALHVQQHVRQDHARPHLRQRQLMVIARHLALPVCHLIYIA